jgi:hypothetical protein
MEAEGMEKQFVIRGVTVTLSREDIVHSLREVPPEPIRLYYVEIDGVAYPIKQVLSKALDLKGISRFRADFTSQHATGVLRGLGFEVKRV